MINKNILSKVKWLSTLGLNRLGANTIARLEADILLISSHEDTFIMLITTNNKKNDNTSFKYKHNSYNIEWQI